MTIQLVETKAKYLRKHYSRDNSTTHRNNESESVVFTLEDFMELEFKSWLCICEHEYLKLVNVTLFEKIIDHNLINDHDLFVCQQLINSGILLINLAVFLKTIR